MEMFRDRLAIVTGGGSGIGCALCDDLAARGTIVVAADVNGESAAETGRIISERGGRAYARTVDVSEEPQVSALVKDVVAEHGHFDYMFNHAGINIVADARDLRIEHWRRVIDANLWGVIYGTMAAYAVMTKQGYGHIVNTSSLSGLIPVPNVLPYSTTKHAIVGLTLGLRAEAADLGVKVSVVCPGFVQTGLQQTATVINAEREKVMTGSTLYKRIEAPEAARAILRGVVRNEAVIVFPGYARTIWLLYRLLPSLIAPVQLRMMREFRAVRSEG